MELERRGNGIRRLTAWVLAALTAGLAVGHAVARQDQPQRERRQRDRMLGPTAGLATLMRPEYLGRDLAVLDEHLGFDESQRWIIETSLLDYETAFQEKLEVVRDQLRTARGQGGAQQPELVVERRRRDAEIRQLRREIEEFKNSGPREPEKLKELTQRLEQLLAQEPPRPPTPEPEQVDALAGVIGGWVAERDALGESFIESVRSILTAEQMERWPAAERALRRQKLLALGRLSGENVNLFFLVRDLPAGAGNQESVRKILAEYEVAIDAALVAREAQTGASQANQISAMLGGDAERAVALAEQEASLRMAVRDVNEKYLEAIAGALAASSPGAAADLRLEYRQSAFPRIYRPTRTQNQLDAALKLPGLDPGVAASLATLRESYMVELEAQNTNLEQITRAQEPRLLAESSRRRAARAREDAPRVLDDPIRAAGVARSELEARYRAQIEALLTPEQLARLPAEALARDGGMRQERPSSDPALRRQMRERFDTNGDGTLDQQEIEKAKEMMRNRRGGGQE